MPETKARSDSVCRYCIVSSTISQLILLRLGNLSRCAPCERLGVREAEHGWRRFFCGRVGDSTALFSAFRGGRSGLSAFVTLGGSAEELALVREVATEATTYVATEPVGRSTDGCRTFRG